MANTSTLINTIPCVYKESDYLVSLKQYRLDFDTAATDLTVANLVDSTKYLAIMGWEHSHSDLHTITVLSGTVAQTQKTLATLKFGAYAGISGGVTGQPLFIVETAKSLVMQSSATSVTILLYVAELNIIRI